MKLSYGNTHCVDCGMNTAPPPFPGENREHYMIYNDVWEQTGLGKRDGMLCVGCLETRIGRKLNAADFPHYPANNALDPANSWRLRERLLDRG